VSGKERERIRKMTKFKFKQGAVVRDDVSNFCGIIIGRVEYRSGDKEYLIQAEAIDNDFKSPHWLGEDRLIEVEPNEMYTNPWLKK